MEKQELAEGVKFEPPVVGRFYAADTDNGRIELYLQENGFFGLGDKESWKKRAVGDSGETRPASVDLDRRGRAYRTVMLKSVSMEDLERWQRYELGKLDRLINSCFELKAKLKIDVKPRPMNDEIFDLVYRFQDAHRPQCKRFKGWGVYPYNVYDYDFDGMVYQHAWDKMLWMADLTLPEQAEKNVSRRFK